jgi:hypothetical protein
MDGDGFGVVVARVIAEMTIVIEGTLSQWVNVSVVDGNVSSISLTPLGEELCKVWANFVVTFAWSMDQMLRTVWSIYSG